MWWHSVLAGWTVTVVELAVGTRVHVTSGPQRSANGELLRYADDDRTAYVRIAIGSSRSAILVVRADAITAARVPERLAKIR
jgi:hypothetical protein